MTNRLRQLFNAKDLRRKMLVVVGLLVVYRIVAHIPVPGIETQNLKSFFEQNQALGLVDVFSGGALSNFSIAMLTVGPYITASIIFQLLQVLVPRVEELSKEGEIGRQKISQYTRLLSIPLAILQAISTILLLQKSGNIGAVGGPNTTIPGLLGNIGTFDFAVAVIAITAGSVLTMWLGEVISEQHIGNGISLIIFAGIIAGIPTALGQTFALLDSSQWLTILIFVALALLTIAGVIFVTEGQRDIPVSYARQTRQGYGGGGVHSTLPLRVNMAGVIPIIFAVSLVIFPSVIAQYLVTSPVAWLSDAASFVVRTLNDNLWYGVIYFVLVVAFSYFYTAVIFHADQISENLQKQGAFIPGVRPGNDTTHYLSQVSNRILLAGSLFLGVIAILPIVVQAASGIQSLVIGGTSLLIVVSVAIETVKQVDAQLVMRDYEGFSP